MNIYIWRDGETYGPFTIEVVKNHLAQGVLLNSDLAFYESMANWLPLPQVLAQLESSHVAQLTTGNAKSGSKPIAAKPGTHKSTSQKQKSKPDKSASKAQKSEGKSLAKPAIIFLSILLLGTLGYFLWNWTGTGKAINFSSLSFREGQAFAPGEASPFNGLAREYYENGQLKMEVSFNNGRENGLKRTWYEDGALAIEGTMKEGQYEGLVTSWKPNGKKEAEHEFKNGQKIGRKQ
jgi:hypothetical protein